MESSLRVGTAETVLCALVAVLGGFGEPVKGFASVLVRADADLKCR